MAIRLAINGYGRIGRCVLRALYESDHHPGMQVVAINEPADLQTIAHLTKYDSTHGRFPAEVATGNASLTINGDVIAVSHHEQLQATDWSAQQVDLVLECTGHYAEESELQQHLQAGTEKVLLSQPGIAPIKPIVMGLNEQAVTAQDSILSAASCTSNCITG